MTAPTGSIRADEVYTLAEACRRLGWGRRTWWQAEKAGLRAVRFGKQKFLRGAAVLEFFERLEAEGNGKD